MFTAEEILKAANGELEQGSKSTRFRSLSTNSRTVRRGDLFIPLIGKKYDGHGFILKALKKGAAGALTSKNIKPVPGDRVIIKVKDTERALQDIARFHRQRFKVPIIGVTGSSGKTTTKDMIASILSQNWKTLKNEENLNNEIGVPLTLLKLDKTHKAAVIEMAMQGAGEIEELAQIVLPKIAVITNIGEAHLQHLGSKKNVAKVKAEILKYLNSGEHIAVLNADDEYFSFLRKAAKRAKVSSFGINGEAMVRASNIKRGDRGSTFDLICRSGKIGVYVPLPGAHNIYNALAAAAAALGLGANINLIARGLKNFKPSSKRMAIRTANGIRIINDSYNANPSSMKAAISVLSEQGSVVGAALPRRIAVLGDMLELGKTSKKAHKDIGAFVAKHGIDVLITKGYLSREIARGAKSSGMTKIYRSASNEEARKLLKKIIKPNDVILIKGSRGMKMEEIAENLLK